MKQEKKENVLAGLTGAFLGSLAGVACIVGIGQLGYVASVSGVIMAVCAIKGYELLGGVMSRKGAVAACILTIFMTYIGNRLDFAVSLASWAETDVFSAFRAVDDLLEVGYLDGAAYWGNLAMLYLFTLMGAVPTLKSAFHRGGSAGMPPETLEPDQIQGTEEEQSPLRIYPFGSLSWTLRLRVSICIAILLSIVALMVSVFMATLAYEVKAASLLVAAMLAVTAGAFGGIVWIMAWLSPFQCIQTLFVRREEELWRVDLTKLNQLEPYRFALARNLQWKTLSEEERQKAQSAIARAIGAIRAGGADEDRRLRRAVLYLPDVQLEHENKWIWKISYAWNNGEKDSRKNMKIGKAYPDFAPARDAQVLERPVPACWRVLFLPLALTVILMAAGWAVTL